MKIFVTGNLGYVGTVLHQRLENNNHIVTGCDINYFPKNWNNGLSNTDKTLRKGLVSIFQSTVNISNNLLTNAIFVYK